jgi:DMSO/TMAO reductase YedYZ molybdopterin-dependent catalytic subunit
MKKTRIFVALFVVLALISACAPAGETVLTVGEKAYTQADLEALGTTTVDYTDKDGETTTYEGVSLITVLEDAGMAGAGQTLVFTAADGYEAEVSSDEALACENCTVAFDEGSLRMVMPDFSGKLQVKEVIQISTK